MNIRQVTFTPSFFRRVAAGLVIGLGMSVAVQAAEYTRVNTQDSRIDFVYSQMKVKMNGRFSELRVNRFQFDTDKPEAAEVALEIVLGSVDAGYGEANKELGKAEWLNLAAHPLASFESSKVEALGGNRYQVTGTLSIKGNAKEVTAPFTLKQDGDTGVFEGELTFQRSDFSIGEGAWKDTSIVANDIQVNFHLLANR